MSTQEGFWDDEEVGPHHRDARYAERTSAEMVAFGSGEYKGNIMGLLRDRPTEGMTDWDLTEALVRLLGHPVSHDATKAMRNVLMMAGYVLPTGRIKTGPFGKPNEYFVAIPEGGVPVPVPDGHKRPPCKHEHLGETTLEWTKKCIDCGDTVKRAPYNRAAS